MGYYRLVESYRNHCDRVCHRTILNAGYIDELTTDQLNNRSGEKEFTENYPGYRFQAVSYAINDEYQWVLKL